MKLRVKAEIVGLILFRQMEAVWRVNSPLSVMWMRLVRRNKPGDVQQSTLRLKCGVAGRWRSVAGRDGRRLLSWVPGLQERSCLTEVESGEMAVRRHHRRARAHAQTRYTRFY